MSTLAELLETAIRDLRNGWHEAVADTLHRARGMAEALEGEHAARLLALEKMATKTSALAELNDFRRADSRRLDDAVKVILAASPAWLSAKEVRKALQCAAFHPLPSERTLRGHLGRIRGKRQHTVMSLSEAYAPAGAAILSTSTGDPEMSLLSAPYIAAFAEASRHSDELPKLLEQLETLEKRGAEQPSKGEEHAA